MTYGTEGLITKLEHERCLSPDEFKELLHALTCCSGSKREELLFKRARRIKQSVYGGDVYLRGLIEFSNYCKNDCYYCGIRKGNGRALRYRLTEDEILQCCEKGHSLGFRTFVLQSGEDGYYADDVICGIVSSIKKCWPDCAVTLSIGEKSFESYKRYYDAGADRYLLRHETASRVHYGKLHPGSMSLENRKRCLRNLKDIGYQVGCGFMVGSPYQTMDCIVEDLLFISEFKPNMVGIGPYLPHSETPFRDKNPGSLELTLILLGIVRMMLPGVLLPSTTALGTIHSNGSEMGIMAGANVLMPNLSPMEVREKYMLYNNKISAGDDGEDYIGCMAEKISGIGACLSKSRGDYREMLA